MDTMSRKYFRREPKKIESQELYRKIVGVDLDGKLTFLEDAYVTLKETLKLSELSHEDKIFIAISGNNSVAKEFVASFLPICFKHASYVGEGRSSIDALKIKISNNNMMQELVQMYNKTHKTSKQALLNNSIPHPDLEKGGGIYMWPVFFGTILPGKRVGVILLNINDGIGESEREKLLKFLTNSCHIILHTKLEGQDNLRAETLGVHPLSLTGHVIDITFSEASTTKGNCEKVNLSRCGELIETLKNSQRIMLPEVVIQYAKDLTSAIRTLYQQRSSQQKTSFGLANYFKECIDKVNSIQIKQDKNSSAPNLKFAEQDNKSRPNSTKVDDNQDPKPVSLWPYLEINIVDWMENQLTEDTLDNLNDVLRVILTDPQKTPSWVDKNCFELYEEEYKPRILGCLEILRKFCSSLNDWQALQISDDANVAVAEMVATNAAKESDTEALVKAGITKLSKEFRNRQRLNRDKAVHIEMVTEYTRFYEETVNQWMKEYELYYPHFMSTICNSLIESIIRSNEDFVKGRWDVADDMGKLRKFMQSTYQHIHTQQMENLEAKWKKLRAAIAHAKSNYDNEIEEVLSSYGNVSESILQREHKRAFERSVQLLRSSIAKDIGNDEPLDLHLISLVKKIETSHNVLHKVEAHFAALEPVPSPSSLGSDLTPRSKYLADVKMRPKGTDGMKCLGPSRPVSIAPNGTEKEKIRELPSSRHRTPLPSPDTKSVHTMIFQMSLSCVRAACLAFDINAKKIAGKLRITTLGSKIGLIMDGDVCKWAGIETSIVPDRAVKDQWTIKEFLDGSQWEKSVPVQGDDFKITPDFLLSVMFAEEKSRVEKEVKDNVRKAIISVPIWFTSFQRQQIFNALSIAGFDNIRIVNESSVEALYLFSTDASNLSHLLTLSESSDRVCICVFSNKHSNEAQTMLGCADYWEIAGGEKAKHHNHGKSNSDLTATENELSVAEKKKFCDLAVERVSKKYEIDTLKGFYVAFNSKLSKKWKDFASWLTSEDRLVEHNDAAILGLVEMTRRVELNNFEGFQDSSLFHVIVSPNIGRDKLYIIHERSNIDSVCHPVFTYTSKMKVTDFQFYQYSPVVKVQFGSLNVLQFPKDSEDIIVSFQYDDNGIIRLTNVEYTISVVKESKDVKKLPQDLYKWNDFNLTTEQANLYRQVISDLFGSQKESKKIKKVVDELIKKLSSIRDAVESKKESFSRTAVKELLLKRIDDEIESLGHAENKTVEEIKDIYKDFNQIATKHGLQELLEMPSDL